mmetsp:Transcript_17302/g.21244  ORF Transcript_17302/g.21244 Transcript_17302/m.21244 type:complete len:138 (+) Transcript_17302:123-536(+)
MTEQNSKGATPMEVESTTQIPPKREVRARPIDVYRRLPIARLKEESVYEYWNEDNSCQNATKNELEHGMVGSKKNKNGSIFQHQYIILFKTMKIEYKLNQTRHKVLFSVDDLHQEQHLQEVGNYLACIVQQIILKVM